MTKQNKVYKVAVIGGGVSGVTVALRLSELGISTILFDKKESVVNGPPFCHLHAGGNLYPDITDEQCIKLLKQSIDMGKLYPESIDKRPTFISVPKSESYEPKDLITRLDKLVVEYQNLIDIDSSNQILGKPSEYYKLYEKEDLESFKKRKSIQNPKCLDDWMIEVAKKVDYNLLKFPVLLVQEYGWNLFRLAAQAQLALGKIKDCDLFLNTEVVEITDFTQSNENYNWKIKTNQGEFYTEYLLNSAGFKTGEFDNDLNLEEERLVEFKAAYVSKWEYSTANLPELIFHGKRGTPNGMAQLTPYADGIFQIHGMTHDITLFDNGLVKSSENNAQPNLNEEFINKINNNWDETEINKRTTKAIDFVSRFVPSFKNAQVGGIPLYGAQQIPGKDSSLRVAEVSFPKKFYARSEIVKASSALDVADQVIENLKQLDILDLEASTNRKFDVLNSITNNEINETAQYLAKQRGYPKEMGKLYKKSIK